MVIFNYVHTYLMIAFFLEKESEMKGFEEGFLGYMLSNKGLMQNKLFILNSSL